MEYFNYTSLDNFKNLELGYFLLKVTPEMADEFLSVSIGNRDINKGNIRALEQLMREGKYFYDVPSSGIAFDKDGKLTNGHHTLTAIKNVGIEQVVILCVGAGHHEYTDTGKSRSMKDSMVMSGNADLKDVSPIATNILRINMGNGITNRGYNSSTDSFTRDEVIKFAKANQDILLSLYEKDKVFRREYCSFSYNRLETGVRCAIIYDLIYNQNYNENDVNTFMYGITSMDTQESKIIDNLRKRLNKDATCAKKADRMSFESVESLIRGRFSAYIKQLKVGES